MIILDYNFGPVGFLFLVFDANYSTPNKQSVVYVFKGWENYYWVYF